ALVVHTAAVIAKIVPNMMAVLAFQLAGWLYQPPAGDQTCLGYLHNHLIREPVKPQWLRKSFHASCCMRQEVPIKTVTDPIEQDEEFDVKPRRRRPKNLQSAKLAALHARLSLPARFSLKTLARCLIHPSAYPDDHFNNSSLALLGQELIAYYTAEWLICNYPRLPMPVIYAAQYAYSGNKTLTQMTREWGVEAADAPGYEVDPGYLQFERIEPGNAMSPDMMHRNKQLRDVSSSSGTGRPREEFHDRRGMSSRIVYDDEFGDLRSGVVVHDTALGLKADVSREVKQNRSIKGDSGGVSLEDASTSFIRAVFAALYLYSGEASMQSFHKAHVLSRHLPLHTLFRFKNPIVDLARLCDREGLEPPVARLISETGRKSRSPVFVVGVYSGREKLGEDAGASLAEGRTRAAAQALRSWYLYSPPAKQICLPSEQSNLEKNGKRWTPQFIDNGEIVT
ncbi:hypothetical protein K461DRAFT_223194, partial [Myriangium duriaei CBS 260.36]